MSRTCRIPSSVFLASAVGALAAILAFSSPQDAFGGVASRVEPDVAHFDGTQVVGPGECAECHEPETAVWLGSAHVSGGKVLTRSDEAKAIASALGVRRIKSDERCASCHFTLQAQEDGRFKAVSEVSCESCHGGAAGWVELHNDFGGTDSTAESETPEHRADRMRLCDEAGMHRPTEFVSLATRCYACHLISDSELVAAGHPIEDGLEFLAGSQGSVRHNFVRGAGVNAPASTEQRRVMFVAGQAVRLEMALRGLARDPGQGECADSLKAAVEAARGVLAAVAERSELPTVAAMLEASDLGPDAVAPALLHAADVVRKAALEFEHGQDGTGLAAIDPLLPIASDS
ncbi:multiheme c-type cytochrome [Engelhardtia mirabilis]|uniref:Cytochrome c-552/4 domain-containing protein n=2 Tax=Engelhardtia mirabilis TaxID=2528011 RepID=A0A518BQF4_9BACT|nr:hypothetical protein Pla133_43070 [Planctomycetes bacterium Pla133]QDV03517.1 hypothetical protein Pla86_43060 [Planctomycetes bacterium Pla86]